MNKNFKWLFLVSLTFAACSSDDDTTTEEPVVIVSGEADFSKYIALGNSLTAGYGDNALYKRGQENSWPKLLSDQFALAGGGEFKIPYMNDNIGGFLFGGATNPSFGPRLYFNGSGPATLPGTPTTEATTVLTGPFNNMGVPGAKIFHLVTPNYGSAAGLSNGTANPYFVRFASSPSTTVIADAEAQNATFFTLWIGNNDVLSYATSGGAGVNRTGNQNPATYGTNDITDPTLFAGLYAQLLTRLTANGAKGAVSNIPDVTTVPYFTTVPYNPVPLDAATSAQLNAGYAAYNGGLQVALNAGAITADEAARRRINFQAGNNAVVMVDEYLTNLSALGLPSYRHATAQDYLVLTSRNFIGTTVGGNPQAINGVSVPLADQWVLSKNEAAEIETASSQYNATIQALATQHNLAFVDARAILTKLKVSGIAYENYVLKSDFVFGGAFSLDGVHPTGRGYALIANEFAKAINAKYGSNLPGVKISDYDIMRSAQLP